MKLIDSRFAALHLASKGMSADAISKAIDVHISTADWAIAEVESRAKNLAVSPVDQVKVECDQETGKSR